MSGVPVAGRLGVDVVGRVQAGRLVDRARRDRDGGPAPVPEEPRAARGAEPAPGAVVLVPAKRLLAVQLERVTWAGRVGGRPAVRPPADAAMADDHVLQRAG